jgi:hypothetical protein
MEIQFDNGGLGLRFVAAADTAYALETTALLNGNSWETLEVIPADPAERSLTIAVPLALGQATRFYRVVTPPPD